jgi:large subunit ribosomal protein L24
MKIRTKDKVKIILGKDKGKTGEVERVYAKQDKVVVKGVNLYKKHVKKSEHFPQGGLVEAPRPLSMGKVMLICPTCKAATRVGYVIGEKGKKQRICRKCKKVIN